MDFSSEVLIEFGLNLAGYLLVALLVYLMVSRRRSTQAAARIQSAIVPSSAAPAAPSQIRKESSAPQFISLALNRVGEPAASPLPAGEEPVSGAHLRQANRRAIYAEARRLLARGASSRDLGHKLPLTEAEIELLSAIGNA